MKYFSHIALLGVSLKFAAADKEWIDKGPQCSAHKLFNDEMKDTFKQKIKSGEIVPPLPTDDDEVKNDWFKEHIYDVTKDECEEGLSCVVEEEDASFQSCQVCHISARDYMVEYYNYKAAGGEDAGAVRPSFTEEEEELHSKNIVKLKYHDYDLERKYICYSDVLATRVILSAGALILSAVASMV